MECVKCGKDSGIMVLIETFQCNHCDSEIHMEYNVCKECGAAWKTVDGDLISGSVLFDVGLGEIFGDDEEMEFDLMMSIDKEDIKREIQSFYMSDYVHKCLKCQTVCYETEENLYKCPKCNFEWEVIKSG